MASVKVTPIRRRCVEDELEKLWLLSGRTKDERTKLALCQRRLSRLLMRHSTFGSALADCPALAILLRPEWGVTPTKCRRFTPGDAANAPADTSLVDADIEYLTLALITRRVLNSVGR